MGHPGVAVDQPVEGNFFPGILEGLLGRLGITAPGEKNPPTSAKECAAQLWASAVLNAVQKMEKSKSPSACSLHRPFVSAQHGQLSVQTSHASSIVWGPTFVATQDHPTIPLESGDDRDGVVPPSPSPSTVGAPTAEKSKAGLPTTPIQIICKSDTGSDKTENLEPEAGSSYSAQVFPPKSDQTLRK